MAQTIQIKRTTTSTSPSGLAFGELAYVDGTKALWVGDNAAGVQRLADQNHPTNWFFISDNTDTTKKIGFVASGITTGTTRTITMPDQNINLTPDSGSFASSSTNTGDVTLAGTRDYLTITGQQITRNAIDLATDISLASSAQGDVLYMSASNVLARLAANATGTNQFLRSVSGGNPSWQALTAGDIPDVYVRDADYSNKGVILVGTGVGTWNALSVGSNDFVLTADSAQATGVKWAAAPGGTTIADVKNSVKCATTGSNITLSGTTASPLDGVTLTNGMRVLVKDQTTPAENGIYDVNTGGAWSRSSDADENSEVTEGMYVFVAEGTVNEGTGWIITTDDPITLGTTGLTFTQMTALPADTVQKALFDANTILAADTNDTPTARTINEQTLVGRITSGSIAGLTGTQAIGILPAIDQSTAEGGSDTVPYIWTSLRVRQNVQAATIDGGTYS